LKNVKYFEKPSWNEQSNFKKNGSQKNDEILMDMSNKKERLLVLPLLRTGLAPFNASGSSIL